MPSVRAERTFRCAGGLACACHHDGIRWSPSRDRHGLQRVFNDFNRLLVEAPGVEAGRDQAKARILKQLRAQLGERVLTIFRRNPRPLVQVVTRVTDSLGATGRADVRAVLVLLDEVLTRIEAERDVGEEAG